MGNTGGNTELVGKLTQTAVVKNRVNRLETRYVPDTPLDDGVYNVTLKAHDAYNTESYARYSFVVDRTPPVIGIQRVASVNPTRSGVQTVS